MELDKGAFQKMCEKVIEFVKIANDIGSERSAFRKELALLKKAEVKDEAVQTKAAEVVGRLIDLGLMRSENRQTTIDNLVGDKTAALIGLNQLIDRLESKSAALGTAVKSAASIEGGDGVPTSEQIWDRAWGFSS